MTYQMIGFACAIAVLANAASAEGLYFGGGLGYSNSTSTPEFGGESTGSYSTLGATVGYKWDGTGMYYSGELDIDVPVGDAELAFEDTACSDGFADGPYFCTHVVTTRLRGLVGTEVSPGTNVFGSLGFVQMAGEGAVEPFGETDAGTASGVTLGAGVELSLGSGTGRFEVIYDNMSNIGVMPGGSFSPEFESVAVKATYLFY